jgi:RND family efflux transporter MFP subunit
MRKSVLISVPIAAVLIAAGVYLMGARKSDHAITAAAPIVETVHPHRVDLIHRLDSNATIEAYETADLYPKVSGYLSEVKVDIGDHVKSGQLLAVISIPELEKELAEDKAQLEAKQADLALQQLTLKRQETLFRAKGITEQALDEIRSKTAIAAAEDNVAAATVEKVKTMLDYTQIVAPFDGVVARRFVNRGDFVQAATAGRTSPLLTVQQISTVRVFCEVPESDVSRLKVGDPASVKPYGMADKVFAGAVARLALRLDPETRNMRTEVDLPNPNELLYPGMYAQVSLETDRRPNALTLPASSIVHDTGGAFVNIVQGSHIERRPIKTGVTEGELVEIIDGLPDDAQVVTIGKNAPPPGSAVQVLVRNVP